MVCRSHVLIDVNSTQHSHLLGGKKIGARCPPQQRDKNGISAGNDSWLHLFCVLSFFFDGTELHFILYFILQCRDTDNLCELLMAYGDLTHANHGQLFSQALFLEGSEEILFCYFARLYVIAHTRSLVYFHTTPSYRSVRSCQGQA